MISKMKFDCKLAHCKEIRKLSGFNSIKELYERISQVFSVPINEILFCTLNTHNFRDMNSLLGSYLSLGDQIIVHLCGNRKNLKLEKTQEYLGLTITDNGHGRAFIKKVRSNEVLIEQTIKPGDHITAINSESTIGMRHYEVARAIREIPPKTKFTLHFIEPLCTDESFNGIADINLENRPAANLNYDWTDIPLLNFAETNHLSRMKVPETKITILPDHLFEDNKNLDSLYEELANSSLPIDRLLSRDTYRENQNCTTNSIDNNTKDLYRITIEKINDILESFLGINDNTLAIQIYRLAKENKDSFNHFSSAIRTSELSNFNFGKDIETYLWTYAKGFVD